LEEENKAKIDTEDVRKGVFLLNEFLADFLFVSILNKIRDDKLEEIWVTSIESVIFNLEVIKNGSRFGASDIRDTLDTGFEAPVLE
jgi:hypothetical protein